MNFIVASVENCITFLLTLISVPLYFVANIVGAFVGIIRTGYRDGFETAIDELTETSFPSNWKRENNES